VDVLKELSGTYSLEYLEGVFSELRLQDPASKVALKPTGARAPTFLVYLTPRGVVVAV